MLRLPLLTCIFVFFIMLPLRGNSTDTLKIGEVTVSSERSPAVYSRLSRVVTVIGHEQIREKPADNIQGILEYVTTIDIRQRGSHGVQADLSMRGGSFEQVLLLLNGVKINDPQTGHHNFNIPVDGLDIERIEILEGPGSRIYGPNAFSGAVNIITREPGGNILTGSIKGGQYGFRKIYFSGGLDTGPLASYLSVGNSTSGGFTDNTDFNALNIFYRGSADAGPASVDIQAGYIDKGFGANSFYSPLYPEQYEKISSTFLNLSVQTGNQISLRQSAWIRRHYDRFELFRYERPDWYGGHNYHMTDLAGTNAMLDIPWSTGNFSLGAEIQTERIFSSVLGEKLDNPRPVSDEEDVFYNYFKQRNQLNLTGSGTIILDKLAFTSGMLVTRNDSGDWGLYQGTDVSYGLSDHIGWFASYNQSLRIPSFTEMYYIGPVHRGNPGLKPEEAGTLETGLRYRVNNWHGHLAAFNRRGKNIIDWVRKEEELIWESRNITSLDTYGLELEIQWNRPEGGSFPVTNLKAGYAFLDISKQSEEYISAYVLDHLKHKIVSGIIMPLHKSAQMVLMAVYQNRAGTYTEVFTGREVAYDPFILLDLGINITIIDNLYFSAEANNLLNTIYTDIGNVPVPGRWIKAGISLTLPGR